MTRLEGVRNVIFDLDGTLIDTRDSILETFRETLSSRGKEVDEKVVIDSIAQALPLERTFERIMGKDGFSDRDIKEFRRYYTGVCTEATLYPGVAELLDALRGRGIGMAVATSKFSRFTHKILEHLGVSPLMVCVVCGDHVDRWKPDPEAVLKVLAEAGWEPGEAMMVGDSPVDIQAGKAAGVRTCGVTWGFGRAEAVRAEEPDLTIEEPSALLRGLCISYSVR